MPVESKETRAEIAGRHRLASGDAVDAAARGLGADEAEQRVPRRIEADLLAIEEQRIRRDLELERSVVPHQLQDGDAQRRERTVEDAIVRAVDAAVAQDGMEGGEHAKGQVLAPLAGRSVRRGVEALAELGRHAAATCGIGPSGGRCERSMRAPARAAAPTRR